MSSIARLTATQAGGATRIRQAFAQSPQRWTFGQPAVDGWAEVSHQLLGDGAFGGDRSRTTIRVGTGASLLVRGIAATPLRGTDESAAFVRLNVADGGTLMYLPGALVPHRGSRHTSSLTVSANADARVFAATTLVRGRSGMGESGAFAHLRLKTRVEVEGALAVSEDAEVLASDLERFGSFGGAQALVTAVCLGDGAVIENEWWSNLAGSRGRVAANRLRAGGVGVRGLFESLGDAQKFLGAVEAALRGGHASCIRSRSSGFEQARVY